MISSTHNPLVRHLVKLRENSHYREEQQRVLITGVKLVRELAVTHTPKRLFMLDPSEFKIQGVEQYVVSEAVLKKITELPSPEPLVAEFPLPPPSLLNNLYPLLVLDRVRDPGNLGTLVRTALALGWAGLFCLPTCVDLFNEKVIRASRGGLFRLPWHIGTWEALMHIKEKNHLTLYIADVEGRPLSSVHGSNKTLLLLSNEAQGVRDELKTFGEKVTIPMEGEMESLNVATAGAILMYQLKYGS